MIIGALVMLVGLPSALSFGILPGLTNIGGKSFFDWLDFITANILLPVGGLITTIFAGYFWKRAADAAGLKAGWFGYGCSCSVILRQCLYFWCCSIQRVLSSLNRLATRQSLSLLRANEVAFFIPLPQVYKLRVF